MFLYCNVIRSELFIVSYALSNKLSFRKFHMKMSSANCQPLCVDLYLYMFLSIFPDPTIHLVPLPPAARGPDTCLQWQQADSAPGQEQHGCWAMDNVLVVNVAHPPANLIDTFDPTDPTNWLFFPGGTIQVRSPAGCWHSLYHENYKISVRRVVLHLVIFFCPVLVRNNGFFMCYILMISLKTVYLECATVLSLYSLCFHSDIRTRGSIPQTVTRPFGFRIRHGLLTAKKAQGRWILCYFSRKQYPCATFMIWFQMTCLVCAYISVHENGFQRWLWEVLKIFSPSHSVMILLGRELMVLLHHEPLNRVKLRVASAPRMPGTFSPSLGVSDPDMHHCTCVMHVLWCMPGSLTSGFLWSGWRGKCPRHSRRMHNPQFYVCGKRPVI